MDQVQIQFCTITGVDDAVDIDELMRLSHKYPFVEWAILSFRGKEGTARFPSDAWVQDFLRKAGNPVNKALHLCGASLQSFMDGDGGIADRIEPFSRIQLNLGRFSCPPADMATKLFDRITKHPEKHFLFQMSDHTQKFYMPFQDLQNVSILYDASAGMGILPKAWPLPRKDRLCGYAGGLNPENIADNVAALSTCVGESLMWIDVESGVRTEDKFDVHKAEVFLAKVACYSFPAKLEIGTRMNKMKNVSP